MIFVNNVLLTILLILEDYANLMIQDVFKKHQMENVFNVFLDIL